MYLQETRNLFQKGKGEAVLSSLYITYNKTVRAVGTLKQCATQGQTDKV